MDGVYEIAVFFHHAEGQTELVARSTDRRLADQVRRQLAEIHRSRAAKLEPSVHGVADVSQLPQDKGGL